MSAGSSRFVCALLLLAACEEPLAPPHSKDRPPVEPTPVAPTPVAPTPVVPTPVAPVPPTRAVPDAAAPSFYTVTEALADAKASPLKFVGIGDWPGNFSIKGCIYRNARVFVVDVYCTYREQPAFSVVIIAPGRGEVRVYAEAEKPISTITRADYFTFNAETYPPLPDHKILLLNEKFDVITTWQQNEYNARLKLPALGACSTEIPECDDPTWVASAKAFVAEPSEDWAWIIDQLRNRAQHDGKYVAKKGTKK